MQESLVRIAKIAINSPLPQLDHLFDYQVPASLIDDCVIGARVRIPFGRGKQLHDGFVVEIVDNSDFEGELGEISEVVSAVPVLSPDIYSLARSVADRQAATLSDVLKHAVPDRSVAVEKAWLKLQETPDASKADHGIHQSGKPGSSEYKAEANRTTRFVEPRIVSGSPKWIREICELVLDMSSKGLSSLVVVPDARDQIPVLQALQALGPSAPHLHVIDYSTKQTKSKRYESFLRCFSELPSVVVGSRSSLYAPVRNLGQIIVWDDGDSSHKDLSAPYSHSRDIALLRQQASACELHFLSHVRSTEIQRLTQIGYLTDVTKEFPPPKIIFSESEARVDSAAWSAIRTGLQSGPVLIQVLSKGASSSAFCASCNKRAACRNCSGPLWIDANNQTLCRWCGANNLNYRCLDCTGSKLTHGRAGSSRTLSDFGRAFPGHTVIEATGDNPKYSIPRSKCIVVSTPGAEPQVDGGYEAVVILDSTLALAMDSLRATEDAVRSWSNAIALMNQTGTAVLVGLTGKIADQLSVWAQKEISETELRNRAELRFPPVVRLASLGAENALVQELIPILNGVAGVEVLGPVKVVDRGLVTESKVLLKYDYSSGAELSKVLKIETMKLSAGSKRSNLRTGRNMRPIRIRMDDFDVL